LGVRISKSSYWAIITTAAIHLVTVLFFAFTQIDFDKNKAWSYINMSLQEIKPLSKLREIEKVKIPKNFEEKGLDAKKYSVAKTNQAVNEATNELSKAQKTKKLQNK
jgi:uncharacterized protein YwgA